MTAVTLSFRQRVRALLHLNDPPWKIALALAVGVFIGCTPLWFFQTLLAIGVAAAFRLNKAAAVTGVWFNLPWIAPFVYGAALKIGTLVLPGQDAAAAEAVALLLAGPSGFAWRDVLAMLGRASGALLVGTTIVGALAAVVTYGIAVHVIASRRGPAAGEGKDHRRAA